MRCLVTGASGFLGSHLVRKLLEDRHEVLAVVRPSSPLWRFTEGRFPPQLTYATLANIAPIAQHVANFRPEVVFHLGWKGGNSRKFQNDPSQIVENIPGSLDLVRIASESACRTYIFLGSCVEYGVYQQPVRETDLPQPKNLYGIAKLATMRLSDELCRAYGMRFAGVRLFWAYGPMDDPLRMIPSVTCSLLRGQSPAVSEGRQLWDFLYVDDAIRALVLLAECESATGIFNLGSGNPLSVGEVVLEIRQNVNPALEIGFGKVPYAPDQVMHLQADISRLREATGWSPQVDLREGIRRTVDWYKRQRNNDAGP